MPDRESFQFFNLSVKLSLTLALSQRERGLTVGDARATPTCNTESYAKFETLKNRLPLQGESAGVRGESTENPKPNNRF
jgi:hypothetical protein